VSKLATVPLAASGMGLSAGLTGAPWWVALAAALLAGLAIPVSSEVRAWLRLRDQRRVQDETLRAIERIAEANEQVRALLQLHQAAGGDAAAASASKVPVIEPQNTS
jgi:uncharacterized membrane protein YhiD involved in acid resistance